MALKFTFLLNILLVVSCATVPVKKDAAFSFAVEAVEGKNYLNGAGAAWHFIDTSTPDDPRYDRGLRLLARSVEGLDLTWAAGMVYRQIAQARRNMEIVPDAIRSIERIIKIGSYDEDMLLTSFIASEEFGNLPQNEQAFIDFYRALDLTRRGNDIWADKIFSALPQGSPYVAEAEFVHQVRLVAEGQYTAAIKGLKELNSRDNLLSEQKNKVMRTLARIAFEERRFDDALVYFESLRKLAQDDPEILLEMAWTHYYMGDSRKTLGLLIALDAPVHRKFISPERYLLEALALRRLCQFGAARNAAIRLEHKYQESFDALSAGQLPTEIEQLRDAATYRGKSKRNANHLANLRSQAALLKKIKSKTSEGLYHFLNTLYAKGLYEAKLRFESDLVPDMENLADELLSAREGVRLIIHELGVSLLRGRRRPPGAQEKPAVAVPLTGDKVFYEFGGEYWTDEIDDLIVIAEDRCID